MDIKKFLIGASASAIILAAAVIPAFAEGLDYGEQPGYDNASERGVCHGSFGYFDGNTNLGVNSLGPGTPTYHGGAVGQETGATGYNNSHHCE